MKVEIEIPEGKKAEWVNEVLTLVDDKPKDVTERIKTFEDARKELGSDHPLVEEYETITCRCGGLGDDIIAYMKLRIIAAALNEGWKPEYTKEEYRYFPWFILYTKEEIDELTDEKKKFVLARSYYDSFADGGVAYALAVDDASVTYSYYGSRLAFRNIELAKYAGNQFIDIWADFVFPS